MSRDNPTWGVPRIQDELALLGIDVAKSTIRKYRIRHRKQPSQTWKTFLKNHVKDVAAVDFFTVHTTRPCSGGSMARGSGALWPSD